MIGAIINESVPVVTCHEWKQLPDAALFDAHEKVNGRKPLTQGALDCLLELSIEPGSQRTRNNTSSGLLFGEVPERESGGDITSRRVYQHAKPVWLPV